MANNSQDKDEKYPLNWSTDTMESFPEIFNLVGSYDGARHGNPSEFLSAMGRPAIEEIIRRLEKILPSCDFSMEYFKLPQTRPQDHYKKGETLWYIPEESGAVGQMIFKNSEVRKVDSAKIGDPKNENAGLPFKYDLHVFFENGDVIPLRSIRTLSKREFMLIHQQSLTSKLSKILPLEEQKYVECITEHLRLWTIPQKKEEVKNLVSVLLQRQEQVTIFPNERGESHYKAGDFVWFFPNDLYDRDMRGAEDSEYDFHFGQIDKVVGDEEAKAGIGVFRSAYVTIKGKDFLLRSNKLFSCEEIARIQSEDLYLQLGAVSGDFEHMMPRVLKDNVDNLMEKAQTVGLDNLEDFFKVLKAELGFARKKPRRI